MLHINKVIAAMIFNCVMLISSTSGSGSVFMGGARDAKNEPIFLYFYLSSSHLGRIGA